MMKRSLIILLFAATLLPFGCTRKIEPPVGPDGKLLVSKEANPDRVVFESELELPKDLQSKVKKTDLLIWDLKNEQGAVVSARMSPVPTFPFKLVVTARQLFEPLSETGHLLFTARIVKFGDEGKPPAKGQLQVMVGVSPSEGPQVENPAVNQKRLDKWMKKQNFVPGQELSVGAKVKAEFSPALM